MRIAESFLSQFKSTSAAVQDQKKGALNGEESGAVLGAAKGDAAGLGFRM